MKKIVAAFDGLRFAPATRDYAIALARQTGMYLVGLFMEDILYHQIPGHDAGTLTAARDPQQDERLRHISVLNFEANCIRESVAYSIHRARDMNFEQVIRESVYADLLLISGRETLSGKAEKIPSRFIKDLLMRSQCPVLVLPEKYTAIEKVILLYDGEPSSVYAIRQFGNLLSQLAILPVDLVSAADGVTMLRSREEKLMMKLLSRHFPEANRCILNGTPRKVIPAYLADQPAGSVVVMGAYGRGRGTLSRAFKRSLADILMARSRFPLFIAHNP
jgi:hypothetical protein